MPEWRSHDYTRYGTTSLFAALNVADGTVISELYRQHRAAEFTKFLTAIDKAVPAETPTSTSSSTTRPPQAGAIRLARPPSRFHVHFTPTGVILDQPGRTVVRFRPAR